MSFWKALSHGIKAVGIAMYTTDGAEEEEEQPKEVRERPRRKRVPAPPRGSCCIAKRQKSVPRYDEE